MLALSSWEFCTHKNKLQKQSFPKKLQKIAVGLRFDFFLTPIFKSRGIFSDISAGIWKKKKKSQFTYSNKLQNTDSGIKDIVGILKNIYIINN